MVSVQVKQLGFRIFRAADVKKRLKNHWQWTYNEDYNISVKNATLEQPIRDVHHQDSHMLAISWRNSSLVDWVAMQFHPDCQQGLLQLLDVFCSFMLKLMWWNGTVVGLFG